LILLALDDWPLRRGFHIVEKAPFFAASLAASVMAFLAQRSQGATVSVDTIPLLIRFENALVSYATYILQALWPADLAVFYPYPLGSSAVPALIAGVVLAAVTALAIRELRRYPYLGIGWFWYVVTLGPVIGLVQIGAQSHADRYTYIPLIGFFIAAVWGLNDLLAQWPRARTALAATAAAACLLLTWFQVQYWKDSVTLYRHTIAAVPGSYIARFNLATVLASEGNTAEAIDQLRETIRLRPGYADAHGQLGLLLARDNHPEQGLAELQTAVRLNPNLVDAHLGLGSALGALGRPAAAAAEFNRAIQLEPDNAGAHYNLAIALSSLGRFDDAAAQFSETVRLTPDDADARFNFGVTLARLGRFDAAAEQLTSALRLRPNFAEAHSVLQDIQQRKRGTR
jgi:Tfp pilus assembly protein PilF